MREFHQQGPVEYDARGDSDGAPEGAEHVAMPLSLLHQIFDAFRSLGTLNAGLVADLVEAAVGNAGDATAAPVKVAPDGELERVERDIPERRHTGVLDLFSEPEGGKKVV